MPMELKIKCETCIHKDVCKYYHSVDLCKTKISEAMSSVNNDSVSLKITTEIGCSNFSVDSKLERDSFYTSSVINKR